MDLCSGTCFACANNCASVRNRVCQQCYQLFGQQRPAWWVGYLSAEIHECLRRAVLYCHKTGSHFRREEGARVGGFGGVGGWLAGE